MEIKLTDSEADLLIAALEKLPSADMAGDMMIDLFGAMLSKKESEMTPDELEAKRIKDQERKAEKERKEKEKQALKARVEVLKAKLILKRNEKLEGMIG